MSLPDKIRAIVLRAIAIAQHRAHDFSNTTVYGRIIRSFFKVPYQELGGTGTDRIKYLTAPSDIKGTVLPYPGGNR